MFTVERRVGRLVEVIIRDQFPLTEVEAMIQKVRLEFLAAPDGLILCAVFHQIPIMNPDASGPLLEMLKRDNPKVVRSGYVLGQRYGSLAMMIDRLVRDAANPERRWFDSAKDARVWLSEVLTKPEARRLQEMLVPF